jgi:choline dehydrogenase-like flavoprotein
LKTGGQLYRFVHNAVFGDHDTGGRLNCGDVAEGGAVMDNPDYLIVGGGSAGATLASRLSENPATRVLLIEAGPDTPPDGTPADIADIFPSSTLNPSYFWPNLVATRRPDGAAYPFPQARIMGGGSSIMGMWALRGVPSDFDAWVQAGAEGWGWSDVLKYYRRLENDLDRDRSQTKRAPYTIRRTPHDEWPAFAVAMERAANARGLSNIADINENPGEGFFPVPVSQSETTRSSSASAYLTREVRRRPNLAIMAETRVNLLRFEGLRACGAVVERAGEITTIDAREVILSAGSIHSPAMLLRSGIGPADELKQLGITPLIDRPGVGRNLQNHPYLHFALTLPPRSRLKGHLRRFAVAGLRLSSGIEGCPEADLIVYALGRVSPRSYGPDLTMIGAAVYAPFSRGRVTLNSADVNAAPDIAFSLLQDPRDPPRMVKAARFAEALLLDPGVAATYNDAFLLPPVMALNQFNKEGFAGAMLAGAAKAVLNAPAPLSRWALGRVLKPGRWFANGRNHSPLSDEDILSAAAPMGHVTSTCSIGRRDNPLAVVDATCRVYGIENLRVVDASIMPNVPSANTNLPTIMVAERAAELIASNALPSPRHPEVRA